MTTEHQRILDARHTELTRLAKWNVCLCGEDLSVVWRGRNWLLYCVKCRTYHLDKSQIKPKPTRAEEVKARLAKMEAAAKNPPKRDYNIDELWR